MQFCGVSWQSQDHREWDRLVWLTYTNNKSQGGAALWFSFCNKLMIRVFVSSDGKSEFVPVPFRNELTSHRYAITVLITSDEKQFYSKLPNPNGVKSYRYHGLFDITSAWDQDGNQLQGERDVSFPGKPGRDGPQYTLHLQQSGMNQLLEEDLRELIKDQNTIDRNCDVLPLSLDDLLNYTTLMLKFVQTSGYGLRC
jgi:hypothetical protein